MLIDFSLNSVINTLLCDCFFRVRQGSRRDRRQLHQEAITLRLLTSKMSTHSFVHPRHLSGSDLKDYFVIRVHDRKKEKCQFHTSRFFFFFLFSMATKEQLTAQVGVMRNEIVDLNRKIEMLSKDNERLHKLEGELDKECHRLSRAMYFIGKEKEILEKERDLAREQRKDTERQLQDARNK